MSTTLEILAATERRLQNSIDTCRGLREILEQAEQERDVARAQVQRLREVLTWYAECTWDGTQIVACTVRDDFNIDTDSAGKVARDALRDTEPQP